MSVNIESSTPDKNQHFVIVRNSRTGELLSVMMFDWNTRTYSFFKYKDTWKLRESDMYDD